MRPFKDCLIDHLAFHDDSIESLEAAANEYEIEGYLKGYDIDQIRSMSTSQVGQEQWSIFVPKTPKNFTEGSLRNRRITNVEGDDSYEFTTKTKGDQNGKPEVNLPATADQFELFKQLADQGLIKRRFEIPSEKEGVKFTFEVDVFYNKKGELVPWVKIDAELPEGMTLDIADFPFVYDEIIIIDPATKMENPGNINQRIGELYKKYFCSGNAYIEEQTE